MTHNDESLADDSISLYVERSRACNRSRYRRPLIFYQEHFSSSVKVYRRVRVKNWRCCCVQEDKTCAKIRPCIDELWPWDVKHEGDAGIWAVKTGQ
jgi:hypothetical protein